MGGTSTASTLLRVLLFASFVTILEPSRSTFIASRAAFAFSSSGRGCCLAFSLHLDVKFLGNHSEHFLNVLPGLCTRLEYFVQLVLFGEFHSSLEGDLSLLLHLTFVSNQIHSDVLAGVLLDLFEPLKEVHECLLTSHVIRKENAVGSPVEDTSD